MGFSVGIVKLKHTKLNDNKLANEVIPPKIGVANTFGCSGSCVTSHLLKILKLGLTHQQQLEMSPGTYSIKLDTGLVKYIEGEMEQGLNLYPHNTDVSIPFVSTLESIVIYMMRKLMCVNPNFIIKHPVVMSPSNHALTKRFKLFINKSEVSTSIVDDVNDSSHFISSKLINAYTELNNLAVFSANILPISSTIDNLEMTKQ
ncbi:hypothetical protein HID58_070629 [Brassica napus]|uniref:Uncharacterized protein n=1 Tax=Brassica napus TaxID=3708 RepID=A0ABQ7YZA2_BRANA|nr:hypothetical protein HID58_070629 [Brassica napus]